jgi:hypothetical protein
MKKFSLLVGAAVGFVLGSRAGRGPYERLEGKVRDVAGRPGVQDTLEDVKAVAGDQVANAKDVVADKVDDAKDKVADGKAAVADKVDDAKDKVAEKAADAHSVRQTHSEGGDPDTIAVPRVNVPEDTDGH